MPQIDIIEQDDDGGFDISGDGVIIEDVPAKPAPSSSSSSSSSTSSSSSSSSSPSGGDFIASETYAGSKKGMVFKTGPRGVGYYRDELAKEFREREAPPTLAANVNMQLVHQRKDGASAKPHSVEVEVDVSGCSSVESAADVKVEIKQEKTCVVSSEYWTGPLEIPLKYSVRPAQVQGWLHDGCMTLRFPIAA